MAAARQSTPTTWKGRFSFGLPAAATGRKRKTAVATSSTASRISKTPSNCAMSGRTNQSATPMMRKPKTFLTLSIHWPGLIEPAPMATIDFVSPEAQFVASFVVKEPTLLVDDLFNIFSGQDGFWQELDHPTEGKLRMTRFPVTFSKTPAENTRHQPLLGEHSVEILREAGYSSEQVESMLASGATKAPETD